MPNPYTDEHFDNYPDEHTDSDADADRYFLQFARNME
jgi:hypothetical protein